MKLLPTLQFNILNTHDQEELIWSGTFLADRKERADRKIVRNKQFLRRDFFYDANTNKVLVVRAFDATNQLLPYLAHIKFSL